MTTHLSPFLQNTSGLGHAIHGYQTAAAVLGKTVQYNVGSKDPGARQPRFEFLLLLE